MKTESPVIAVAPVTDLLNGHSLDVRLLCSIKSHAVPSPFTNARIQVLQSSVSKPPTRQDSSCVELQQCDPVAPCMKSVSSNTAASTEIMASKSTVIESCNEHADINCSQLQRELRSTIESTSASLVQSDCCNTDSCLTKPVINGDNSITMSLLQADDCQTLTRELPVGSTKEVLQLLQPDKSQKCSPTTLSNSGSSIIIHKPQSSVKQCDSNSSKVLPVQVSDKLPVASFGFKADSAEQSETVMDVKDNIEERRNSSPVASKPTTASNSVRVIREVYENGQATEYFAMQLDFALESGVGTIVIEPSRLGRETSQWLAIGSILRRSALVMGSVSVLSGALETDWLCLPLGALATVMSTLHVVSWRPDPCSRYRVERNTRRLQRLPLHGVTCSAPVVLVKCENLFLRNLCYDSVSFASVLVGSWRLYKLCSER